MSIEMGRYLNKKSTKHSNLMKEAILSMYLNNRKVEVLVLIRYLLQRKRQRELTLMTLSEK